MLFKHLEYAGLRCSRQNSHGRIILLLTSLWRLLWRHFYTGLAPNFSTTSTIYESMCVPSFALLFVRVAKKMGGGDMSQRMAGGAQAQRRAGIKSEFGVHKFSGRKCFLNFSNETQVEVENSWRHRSLESLVISRVWCFFVTSCLVCYFIVINFYNIYKKR